MQSCKRKQNIIIAIILLLITVISFLIIFASDFLTADENNYHTSNNNFSNTSKSEKIINIPNICQFPSLPTGCEAVAATMVLNFYNADIKAEDFAENWLTCDNNFYNKNGKLYGPDPNEVFVGDPFSSNSYGCFAGAICKAVNENSSEYQAEQLKADTINELCEKYISNNSPILIWATMGMKPSKNGREWRIQENEPFTWISGEHCLVLVGYDDNHYYFNDPQSGSTVAFEREISEKRYKELGFQAVYIHKNNGRT